jgi:prephenate dehydrogenase
MPLYKKAAIIGLGLIGGSLALAIKRKIPGLVLMGVDDESVLNEALRIGAVDEIFPRKNMHDAVERSELVFLATPIDAIIRLLPSVAESAPPGSLVTDVGSTKKQILETAASCFSPDRYFIGGHPMAGSEGRGIAWADALLFENAVYVLTPEENTPPAAAQRLGSLLEQIGAKVLFLSPSMHDQMAAAVSHLPQIAAVALVNLVAKHQNDSPLFLKLAAGGFRDMTRIASSPYYVWKDILKTNQHEILHFLDEFIQTLQAMRPSIGRPGMEPLFESAARHRLSIPKDTKGFLKPHYDVLVRVEDKPGVISAVSTALAGESINIKDIEVLKVREDDSGTLRLSIETPELRERAIRLLNAIGYQTKST